MSSSFTVPQPLSAVFGWENTLDSKRKWNAQRKQLQVTKVDEGKVLVLLNFKCWYSHGLVVTSTRHSQNPKSLDSTHARCAPFSVTQHAKNHTGRADVRGCCAARSAFPRISFHGVMFKRVPRIHLKSELQRRSMHVATGVYPRAPWSA